MLNCRINLCPIAIVFVMSTNFVSVALSYVEGHVDVNTPVIKMPMKVKYISKWPSDAVLPGGGSLIRSDDKYVKRARESALQWINKIIAPDWMPQDSNYVKNNLILIQNEYDLVDTIYVKWERNESSIQVRQTKTVIAVKISPTKPQAIRATTEVRKNFSKQLCSQILNRYADVEIVGPNDSHVVTKDIMDILLKSSFDYAEIQEASDRIYSRCRKLITNSEEDQSNFDYWWRRVSWWTDGNSVGLYTLKTEGGAWFANYESKLDESWFEPSPDERKTSTTLPHQSSQIEKE